jgi:hypothetical protein
MHSVHSPDDDLCRHRLSRDSFALPGRTDFDTVRSAMMNQTSTEQGRLSVPTLAELALSGKRLPLLTRAVVVGESVRRAALARHRVPSMTLAGKDESGNILNHYNTPQQE